LTPPSKILVKIGIERHGRKASGTGRGSPPYRGRRQDHRVFGYHHLQRDLLGPVRNFWDYRSLTPFSKVLVMLGIERYGRKASGTGQGSPPHRGRRRHTERLAPRLQRDPIGAVRYFWDFRGMAPPSKVLVKIVIERHGRKPSGTSRRPPIYRGRRRDA
jgi:hypothetical protein